MAWFSGADEPGVDRVRERAGGVDEKPDPQVSQGFEVWGWGCVESEMEKWC
jgi:hypothetical protein